MKIKYLVILTGVVLLFAMLQKANLASFLSDLFKDNRIPPAERFIQLSDTKKRDVIVALSKSNPKFAWEYLKKASSGKAEFINEAHEFSHIIGSNLYKKYGSGAVALCSNDFTYGCYHGAVAEALATQGLSAIPQIEANCLKVFQNNKEKDPRECMHGLGHGIVELHHLQLSPSLKDCNLLNKKEYRTFCYLGVFMEYTFSNTKNQLDPNNPWKFCTDLSYVYQSTCAVYIPQLLTKNSVSDTKQLGKTCMSAGERRLWQPCVSYIGSMVAWQSLGKKDVVKNECSEIEDINGQAYCTMVAAYEIKHQKYSDWQETGMSLCHEVPEFYINECVNRFNTILN